jgi:hypothetical protein
LQIGLRKEKRKIASFNGCFAQLKMRQVIAPREKCALTQEDVQACRRETTRKAGILSGSSEVLAKELRFNE